MGSKKPSKAKPQKAPLRLPVAAAETLRAVQASKLLDPSFLRTYEELYKHPTGVTGAELDDILKTSKAHAHLVIFRQKGMCQRVERRRSNTSTQSLGWAEAATNVVPTEFIGWKTQTRKGNGLNDHVGTRKLWTSISKLITNHYASQLKGLDPTVVKFTLDDVATDLRICQIDISRRFSTAASKLELPKQHELEDACEVLGIQLPRPGRPLDVTTARRNYKNMARNYHPDLNNSDNTQTSQFDRIAKALAVIKRWDTEKKGHL